MQKIRSKVEALSCPQNSSRAQGRVTPKLIDGCGQNSNSSEVLWLPLLPVSLMMVQSKMKMLSCLQHFLYCKSMGNIFDAQEQVTPMRIGRSGTISNLSKILCLSLLPARLKKIRLKMKALSCPKHCPHYKPMGVLDFGCRGNQSFDPICPKTLSSLSPIPIMLHTNFDRDWPSGLRDIQV